MITLSEHPVAQVIQVSKQSTTLVGISPQPYYSISGKKVLLTVGSALVVTNDPAGRFIFVQRIISLRTLFNDQQFSQFDYYRHLESITEKLVRKDPGLSNSGSLGNLVRDTTLNLFTTLPFIIEAETLGTIEKEQFGKSKDKHPSLGFKAYLSLDSVANQRY